MLHIEHRKIERKNEERWLQLQCLQEFIKKNERKKSEKEEEDFEVTAYGSRTVYIYEEISENIGFIRD